MRRKTKYPRRVMSDFIQLAEYNCIQVNVHFGKKYAYWFIEPNEKPVKLLLGEYPQELQGKIPNDSILYNGNKKLRDYLKNYKTGRGNGYYHIEDDNS